MPIFTFGFGQAFPNGYVELESRDMMLDTFGRQWSMEYLTTVEAGIDQWNMQRVGICPGCRGVTDVPTNLERVQDVRRFCPTVFDSTFECAGYVASGYVAT